MKERLRKVPVKKRRSKPLRMPQTTGAKRDRKESMAFLRSKGEGLRTPSPLRREERLLASPFGCGSAAIGRTRFLLDRRTWLPRGCVTKASSPPGELGGPPR